MAPLWQHGRPQPEAQPTAGTGNSSGEQLDLEAGGPYSLYLEASKYSNSASMTALAPGEEEPLLAKQQLQQESHLLLRWLPSSKQQPGHPTWAHFMQTWKIPLILFYYGFCSSTLIVINKVAVHNLRAPVFILVLQLLFAAGSVKFLTALGTLDAENLQWRLVRPFLLIIVGFLGTVFGECCVCTSSPSSSCQHMLQHLPTVDYSAC